MVLNTLRSAESGMYAAAERDRGNWDIDETHWHYKLYKTWLNAKKPNRTPPFSFCPYWRAVLLWAIPRLAWTHIGRPVYKMVPFKGIITTLMLLGIGLFIVYMLVTSRDFRVVVGWSALGIPTLIGLALTAQYWWSLQNQELYRAKINPKHQKRWWPVIVAFTVPALALTIVVWALLLVMVAISWVFEDFELHKKVGKTVTVGAVLTARVLDAHPARFPRLRAWSVILGLGTIFLVTRAGAGLNIPWLLLGTVLAAEAVAFAVALGVGAIALSRRVVHYERKRITGMFEVVGFRKWLWESEDDAAYLFRGAYSYKLHREALPAEFAATVRHEDAYKYLRAFLRNHPLPAVQAATVPWSLRPRGVKTREPWVITILWQHFCHFWAGTWALVRLIWAGGVYLKKTKACPNLKLKHATDEPATS